MDGSQFDTITRLASEARTRRLALLTALGGMTAAGLGLATFGETEAKKRKKRKKRKKKKCKKCKGKDLGVLCSSNKECCTNQTNLACAVKNDASNSDTTCCGATGFSCSSSNDCCAHYSCDGGSCQPSLIP